MPAEERLKVGGVLLSVLVVMLAYLMGAVPTGLLVARWRGIDIRQAGSGNIGATNVLRSVGPWSALLVVLVDPLKGVLAVLIPTWLGLDPWWVAAAALAAVIGNGVNVFLGFRGGKGVATSLGVFVMIEPSFTLVGLAIFAITLASGRIVSLASVVAISATPVIMFLGDVILPNHLLAAALAVLTVWNHRQNLQRLAQGRERRLGSKEPLPPTP